jgi:mRNA-degrading endonuclease toxin of MazEF toxin-antitoxin module
MARREVVIRQGDLFWVAFSGGRGSEPWGRRPALILQHNRFNTSRLL